MEASKVSIHAKRSKQWLIYQDTSRCWIRISSIETYPWETSYWTWRRVTDFLLTSTLPLRSTVVIRGELWAKRARRFLWRSVRYTGKSTASCTTWNRSSRCCFGSVFTALVWAVSGACWSFKLGTSKQQKTLPKSKPARSLRKTNLAKNLRKKS